MLSFIKKLLGFGPAPTAEAPYKVEATVEVAPVVEAPAPVVEAPAEAPAKKPRAKKPAAMKAPKAPKTPKAKK